MRVWLALLIVLTAQNALACGVNTGSAQYEKNIENDIAQKRQQVEKMKKLGLEEESETVMALQKQFQDSLESQPISKNVDVEKYDLIYNKCVAKLDAKNNTVTAPIAPCSNSYPVKECASEAFEGSKK